MGYKGGTPANQSAGYTAGYTAIQDVGFVYAPYIPLDGKMQKVPKNPKIVEKLSKNLEDGWAHNAIRYAARINDVTEADIRWFGSDALIDLFGLDHAFKTGIMTRYGKSKLKEEYYGTFTV